VGVICSMYTVDSVLLAMLATALLVGGLTIYAATSKTQKTKASHIAPVLYYCRFIGIACGLCYYFVASDGQWRFLVWTTRPSEGVAAKLRIATAAATIAATAA